MKILGVHIGHDSSAALVVDGRIVADVAEERFTRKALRRTADPRSGLLLALPGRARSRRPHPRTPASRFPRSPPLHGDPESALIRCRSDSRTRESAIVSVVFGRAAAVDVPGPLI